MGTLNYKSTDLCVTRLVCVVQMPSFFIENKDVLKNIWASTRDFGNYTGSDKQQISA